MPEAERDPGLSIAAREAMIAGITTATPALEAPGPAAAAITLRALLSDVKVLTAGERQLLLEWLDRIVTSCG
jgi:hypothetical protein